MIILREMLMLYQVLALLGVHYVADFLLQSHWQAQNKSKNSGALMAHVMTYLACLVVAGPFVFPQAAVTVGLGWCALNGWLHFCTDWVTSRWTSRLWSEQRWHDFFAAVGLDQLIHYATLLLTARLMGLL
jgi:protein-S-isoprenylcysteine O-methyltransferase Ste14